MSQPTVQWIAFVQGSRDFRASSISFLLEAPTPNNTPPLIDPMQTVGSIPGTAQPLKVASGEIDRFNQGQDVIGIGYGGTGLSGYLLGDLLYASALNTISRLPGETTTIRHFLSSVGNGTSCTTTALVPLDPTDIPSIPATKITSGIFTLPSGLRVPVTTITAAYLITSANYLIRSTSSTAIIVTLPAATGSGQVFKVKVVGTGLVTLTAAGSDKIDGTSTITLAQYDCAEICDSSSAVWDVI